MASIPPPEDALESPVPLPTRFITAVAQRGLPTPLTSFVGRDRESVAIASQLRRRDIRLLTLSGPGGVGKTRLALQVAHELIDDFSDGIVFVPLASLRDPALVLVALAQAVGARDNGTQPLLERLRMHLASKEILVIVDSLEHVLSAASSLADLLGSCEDLTLLATSRARLGVSGEHLFPVTPLSLPEAGQSISVDQAFESEAVRLFVDRASAIRPDFALTESTTSSVVEICRRLEGLPLAIELAASRIALLDSEDLLAWLSHRLSVLTGGPRDQPDRLRTMRNAIAWSYDLLSPEEQRLFRCLGLFASSWTLGAATFVCSADEFRDGKASPDATSASSPEVFEIVSSLVDQSLVQRIAGEDGSPRFMILETIREFSRLQLDDSGEADLALRRFAGFYLNMAEESDQALVGPEQSKWLARLEVESGNLRVALEWSAEQPDACQGLRLATALSRFWMVHGHVKEGRGWLEHMLARRASTTVKIPPEIEARALSRAGWLAHYFDYEAATPLLSESLELYRQLGDTRGVADVLSSQGMMARSQGDYESAVSQLRQCADIYRDLSDHEGIGRSLYRLAHLFRELGRFEKARSLGEECLNLFRELGDKSGEATAILILSDIARDLGETHVVRELCGQSLELFRDLGELWGVGFSLYNLGMASAIDGNFESATSLVGESVDLFRGLENDPSIAESLTGLGRVACKQGDLSRAQASVFEALDIVLRGSPRLLNAMCLECACTIARMMGDGRRATTLAAAAASLREEIRAPVPPSIREELDAAIERSRKSLNSQDFDEAWQTGFAMPINEAMNLARSIPNVPNSVPSESLTPAKIRLTDREVEVLRLIAAGLTDRQIGESLFISPRTVHRHVSSLYEKLDAHTRTGAVAAGQSAGLLS